MTIDEAIERERPYKKIRSIVVRHFSLISIFAVSIISLGIGYIIFLRTENINIPNETISSIRITVFASLFFLYFLLVLAFGWVNSMLAKQYAKFEEFFKIMHEKALTDDLTGLFNRRYLDPKLTEELQRATRYNRPLSIIILDIDHFKLVNDQLGHQIGDEVLKKTASLIRANSRQVDIAARYGGDEFVVLMPETEGINAIVVAERLCKAYLAILKEYRCEALPLTVSCGIAEYPSSAEIIQDLITAADKALYYSKEKGRNRFTYYNDLPEKVKLSQKCHEIFEPEKATTSNEL